MTNQQKTGVAIATALVITGAVTYKVVETPTPKVTQVPSLPSMKSVSLVMFTNYFAVTATNIVGESEFSNEVRYVTNTPNYRVTLAWGAVTNATGYRLYFGSVPGGYTNVTATVNTSVTVQVGKAPLTNCVTVLKAYYATNIAGQWLVFTNWPEVRWTNAMFGDKFIKSVVTMTNY